MTNGADRKKKGDLGELYVQQRLEQSGYSVICSNYRRKCGEIDIIAEKDNLLVFTEVKTRTENPLVGGIYAVNAKKQEKLVRTAQLFLEEKNISDKEIRFDVAEVFITKSEIPTVTGMNYYENAFDPSGRDLFLFV